MSGAIPKQTAVYDERRNSSRVFPVPLDAHKDALAALDHFRRTQADLYAWVAQGAPRLTEAEHVARFGEPFQARPRRRGLAPSL